MVPSRVLLFCIKRGNWIDFRPACAAHASKSASYNGRFYSGAPGRAKSAVARGVPKHNNTGDERGGIKRTLQRMNQVGLWCVCVAHYTGYASRRGQSRTFRDVITYVLSCVSVRSLVKATTLKFTWCVWTPSATATSLKGPIVSAVICLGLPPAKTIELHRSGKWDSFGFCARECARKQYKEGQRRV